MRWTDTLLIDVPTERVWAMNTDVEHWPSFTPTMQAVHRLDDGPFGVGSQARVKQPGQRPAVWTVTRLLAGQEFSWQTVRRGLTLTATHRVERAGEGARNTLELEATGPLSGPFGLAFASMIRRSLRRENAGIKAAAEQHTATT